MFISCPVSFDLSDAEWFDNVNDAKDDALVWSVELNGENVVVYEAVEMILVISLILYLPSFLEHHDTN